MTKFGYPTLSSYYKYFCLEILKVCKKCTYKNVFGRHTANKHWLNSQDINTWEILGTAHAQTPYFSLATLFLQAKGTLKSCHFPPPPKVLRWILPPVVSALLERVDEWHKNARNWWIFLGLPHFTLEFYSFIDGFCFKEKCYIHVIGCFGQSTWSKPFQLGAACLGHWHLVKSTQPVFILKAHLLHISEDPFCAAQAVIKRSVAGSYAHIDTLKAKR